MNGWLNIFKPRGISSAKAVHLVKRAFKGSKVGHTGTLDLEAEGVLPIAIGEATKLVSLLVDAKKEYEFTIQFGASTDTADSAGKILESCSYIPGKDECIKICSDFIGSLEQIPPAYSALKINGERAYKIAREGREVKLNKRTVTIYDLKCTGYCLKTNTASYICQCSKGTYIRTLAEDISLALQSLGYVIELRRSKVGMFNIENSTYILDYSTMGVEELKTSLQKKCLKVESVLDDIPVLEANDDQARKIRFGQTCHFDSDDCELSWVRHNRQIVAIGYLHSNSFKSSRVLNLNNGDK
jgi:tRNA pseudouridine55 synthase